MAELKSILGDATRPDAAGPKVIVHICNDSGGWGRGFVVALSKRWRAPEADYRTWKRDGAPEPFALGEVRFVPVEDDLWVGNMIAQHGTRAKAGVPPIRYKALEKALEKVASFADENSASVHMPRIGCGLAGGTWNQVGPIVQRQLVDVGIDVTVYDFE